MAISAAFRIRRLESRFCFNTANAVRRAEGQSKLLPSGSSLDMPTAYRVLSIRGCGFGLQNASGLVPGERSPEEKTI